MKAEPRRYREIDEEYTQEFTVYRRSKRGPFHDHTVLTTKSRKEVIAFLESVEHKGLSNYRVNEWEAEECPECSYLLSQNVALEMGANEWLDNELEAE